MGYEYDIFVSYRRTSTMGPWVRKRLVPLLEARINEVAKDDVRLFCDEDMPDGANLPEQLKLSIRRSALLLTVWSADYFRSAWCMAEWQSFRERETMLGMFNATNPQGLVYPIRYADGDNYHSDAKPTLCKKDFSDLNYVGEAFIGSPEYLQFEGLVKQMAQDLAARLDALPPWNEAFPVVEPPPMRPARIARPVL
jgi:hypothetical protein